MWSRNKRLGELSLRSKLVISGLLPSVLVLLIGIAAVVAYDLYSYRAAVLRDLQGHAHFISLTTRASLQFQSFHHAANILNGLQSNPEVTAAALYDSGGVPRVQYFPANRSDHFLPQLSGTNVPAAPKDQIWLFHPMTLDGQQIGTVFIEGGLMGLWSRFWVLLAVSIGALLLLLPIAFVFSTRLQRHIAQPLYALAGTARAISERKDFSVRAPEQPGPEFRLLTQAFNQMLGQIEAQNAELRSRAAALEQANAELESFSYSVAHDLRAPLRSLSGFSHLISAKFAPNLPEEAQDYLKRIRLNAERMASLIDDLLALSHLDREPMKLTEVLPETVVKDALEELEPQIREREIDLRLDPLPAAQADPTLLRQVYVNLLANAFKYSRKQERASVHIGARIDRGTSVYFVADNGVGFDMRHAPKLFRVFQRLHSANEFEGTGVGLAIVQRIVTRHGGRVWAESEPGRGATFYFTLTQGQN